MVRTAGGAALIGLGMVISGTLGYVQTVAMTHMVARSAYGVFVVVFTTVTFVGGLTKIGLDGTLLRFLPAYRAKRELGLAAGLVRFALFGPTGVGLACAAVLFAVASPLARFAFHSEAYATPLREGAVLIPLSSLQGILLNGLLAMKAVKWQVGVGKVIEPVMTPALLVVFYLLGLRLEALIFAYVGGILVSIVVGWVVFSRAVQRLVRGTPPEYAPNAWVRFGAPMLFSTMTNSVIQSTDVLGVGAFSTAAQVGVYRVADRVSSLISIPIFALSTIFAPTIAELHARGDHRQLESMFAVITRWTFALSFPIFLCCVIFAGPILGMFGSGYTTGRDALLILAVGNIVNAGTGPVGNMIAMTGRVRVLWLNTALRLAVNVALIVALVPPYGVVGAAVASSLTMIVFNVAAIIEVWWIMKIQPYRWDILKPVMAGGVATAVGVLLLRVTHAASGVGTSERAFMHAFGLSLAFLVAYALALIWMGLSAEDLAVFAAIRAKLRGA